MTEQYEQLANELVQVNEALLHQPAQDLLSKLSRGEHFVLNYLLTHYGQAHPTDLSRHMVVSTARIAALLNRMEEKGLIRRTTDENDQRQKRVSATEKGREMKELVQNAFQDAEAAMARGLRPDEAETLRSLLGRVIENLEEDRTTC